MKISMPKFGSKTRIDNLSLNHLPAQWWVLIIVGGILCAAGVFMTARYTLVHTTMHSDFTNDYRAAQALRAGNSIYGATNDHPPFMTFMFVPLTLLPYRSAFLLWSLLSLCFYIFSIWCVVRTLRIETALSWTPLLLGTALCWYPFLAHVALGQVSLFLLVCLIGGWGSLRREQDWLAGGLFGFATAVKLFPGLVILYLLLRKRWKALGTMALVALSCSLLPLLAISPKDFALYFLEVAPRNAARCAVFPVNSSLTGAFSKLFLEGAWIQPLVNVPWLARLLIVASSLLVLAGLCWQLWRLPLTQWGDDFAFAYVCVAMILLSPISWQHVFPLLLLPFGLLVKVQQVYPRQQLRTLSLLAFTLLSLPDVEIAKVLMQMFSPYRMPWFAALVFLAPTAGLFLLWYLLDRSVNSLDQGRDSCTNNNVVVSS